MGVGGRGDVERKESTPKYDPRLGENYVDSKIPANTYMHICTIHTPQYTLIHCKRTGTLLLLDRKQHLPRAAGMRGGGDDDDYDGDG